MIELFKSLARDDGGATMVEYGLMLGLIAVVCIVSIQVLGTRLSRIFDHTADSM